MSDRKPYEPPTLTPLPSSDSRARAMSLEFWERHICTRHYVQGFLDALFNAKREHRGYDPEEAKQIAMALAKSDYFALKAKAGRRAI